MHSDENENCESVQHGRDCDDATRTGAMFPAQDRNGGHRSSTGLGFDAWLAEIDAHRDLFDHDEDARAAWAAVS